jgi:hypothetical protein
MVGIKIEAFPLVITSTTNTMGFDFCLELRLRINETTGLPDLGWNMDASGLAIRIPYVPENYVVPEKYRGWTTLRGRHLHMYITTFMDNETDCDAQNFFSSMPTWDSIKEQADTYEGWTLEKHTEFVEAMSWFASRPGFYVTWSY